MRNQQSMVEKEVLDPLEILARVGLDPKAKGDGEAERYALLCIANIAVSPENHASVIKSSLDTLIGFSKSSDIKCRQHAMFALVSCLSRRLVLSCYFLLPAFSPPLPSPSSGKPRFRPNKLGYHHGGVR